MTLWMGCLNRSVRILNAAASILLIKPAHLTTSPAFKTVHTNTDVWRTVHWVLEVPAVWSMKWFVVRRFFNVSNQKNLINYIIGNVYRRCISLHQISGSVFFDWTFTVVKHQLILNCSAFKMDVANQDANIVTQISHTIWTFVSSVSERSVQTKTYAIKY